MTLIMVVDDDQDLAEMLAIVLTGDGMEVDLVSRGDQVIDVFRNSQPDLVLLDLMLPGLDGIEVCRLIRAESMIPIVMLTAKGDTTDVVSCTNSTRTSCAVKVHPSQSIGSHAIGLQLDDAATISGLS